MLHLRNESVENTINFHFHETTNKNNSEKDALRTYKYALVRRDKNISCLSRSLAIIASFSTKGLLD